MRNMFLDLEKSTAEKLCPSVLSSRISSLAISFYVHELNINSLSSDLDKTVRKYLNLYGMCKTHKNMQMVSNMWKGLTSRVIRLQLACPG